MKKTGSVLDNLFEVRKIIVESEKPLSAEEVSKITGMSIRSAQRYSMRLATERLVEFRYRTGTSGYEYFSIGSQDANDDLNRFF